MYIIYIFHITKYSHFNFFLTIYSVKIILTAIGTLKNSKCRKSLSLNSPCLPEDRSSKQNSIVINPLPRSFINQGRLTLITGEKFQKSTPHSSKLCHQRSHLPSISLEAHLLSPKKPHSPSFFPTKVVLKPEF